MQPNTTHLSTFHAYISAGVRASLQRVEMSPAIVSEPDREQAWHMLSFALSVPDAWEDVAALFLALAPKMERAGFRTTWLPYLQRGLVAAQSHTDLLIEAELLLAIGHLQQRLGNLIEADAHVQRAVDLFHVHGSPLRLGAALNRLAEIARLRQDIARAEQLTDAALPLLVEDQAEQGHSYLIKSRITFNQREWRGCRQHLERALALCERAGDTRRTAVCLLNLGRVCQIEHDYTSAIDYDKRAIAMLEQAGDLFNRAVAQMNLGIVHSLRGEPQAALEHYARAEDVFRRLQDNRHLAKLANNQGIEMHNLQRWQEAIERFQTSSALFLHLENWQEYVNAQDNLGLVYLDQADCQKAVAHYTWLLTQVELHAPARAINQGLYDEVVEHMHKASEIR
jgi:tetratricopeptide (TPR) repeat protein